MTTKSHYEILGVSRDADEVVIRAAYRALAQKYHPDKAASESRINSATRMKEINEAYSTLGDALKRDIYDKSLDIQKKGFEPKETVAKRSFDTAETKKSFSLEGIFLMGFAILLLWIVLTLVKLV